MAHGKEPYVNLGLSTDVTDENPVYIGVGAIFLPGVTVGKCAVIGAGAVVTGDLEANSIYAGIPAKKIRDLGIEKGGRY